MYYGGMPVDLSNYRCGRLLALKPVRENGFRKWKCRCDCGRFVTVVTASLVSGKTQSCGCLHMEILTKSVTKHGMTKRGNLHPLFGTWWAMKQRCYDQNCASYKRYGARGITVCEQWRNDFATFVADMGSRPEGMTLERKDNNRHYGPDNCEWATRKRQAENRRTSKFFTHDGERLCVQDWAARLGVHGWTLGRYLKSGYTLAQVFALKKIGKFPRKKGQRIA